VAVERSAVSSSGLVRVYLCVLVAPAQRCLGFLALTFGVSVFENMVAVAFFLGFWGAGSWVVVGWPAPSGTLARRCACVRVRVHEDLGGGGATFARSLWAGRGGSRFS